MTCTADGYGAGPWGEEPYGGPEPVSGDPLPYTSEFDIFCIGPCAQMEFATLYFGVTVLPGGDNSFVDSISKDQILRSGGSYPDVEAKMTILSEIPSGNTLEWTWKLISRPIDFATPADKYLVITMDDETGKSYCFYFSDAGIAYSDVLGSASSVIPDSTGLITLNEYWTFRVVVDVSVNKILFFATKTADLPLTGHQLRFILSTFSSPPSVSFDSVTIRALGTVTETAYLKLDSICMGTGSIYPNLRPIADAGTDVGLRMCSIARLDGSKSYDPEGAPLIYKWRLIDAPYDSEFCISGHDGYTLSSISGYVDKFYSDEFNPLVHTIAVGDVLLLNGVAHTIEVISSDIDGYFVQVATVTIPEELSSRPFKVLHQNGIDSPTSIKPVFYPDVVGIFKFDLVVFDGSLYSEPSVTTLFVQSSSVARGVIPDLSLLWDYLSEIWGIVEDREPIETYFSAAFQAAASELLTLWQIDYNNSLTDIQRTFIRKWLSYSLLLEEINPSTTTIRKMYGGVASSLIPATGSNQNGLTVVITSTVHDPITATFVGTNPIVPSDLRDQLLEALQAIDESYEVTLVYKQSTNEYSLRVTSSHVFSVDASSTSTIFSASYSTLISGSSGAYAGDKTYKVEIGLLGLDVVQGDYLYINGDGYKIDRIITDAADSYEYQRIVLFDDISAMSGADWSILPYVKSKTLSFYSEMVVFNDKAKFDVIDASGDLVVYTADVLGATSKSEDVLFFDATAIDQFLSDASYTVQLGKIQRQRYVPIDELITDVPYLQETIKDPGDEHVLRRNVDFYIEDFRDLKCIRFEQDIWEGVEAVPLLWGEYNYLDNRPVIEANFGAAVNFTLDDMRSLGISNLDYLSSVQGLWYAHFKAPTISNLRIGAQILLGLPFAESKSTILEIRNDFSPNTGRILLQDAVNSDVVRSYKYPSLLGLETNPATGVAYAVGDTVEQFAPLVNGVEVDDYVKNPTWFYAYMAGGNMFEVQKFFKFVVRVDSAAFNLNSILFIQQFAKRVKATYTYPTFAVRKDIEEDLLEVDEDTAFGGTLSINTSVCTSQVFNQAYIFDQWEPGPDNSAYNIETGIHTVPQFDVDADPGTPIPSFPTAEDTAWGYDKMFICPESEILGTASLTSGSPITITYDSIFVVDVPVYQNCDPGLPVTWSFDDPPLSAGTWCTFFVL